MAYRTRLAAFVALIFSSLLWIVPASGQAIPKSLQGGDPESTTRERKNTWTVGLVGGLFEGTFMRFAEEIRKVIDDGDEMRVLPIVSRGTAANLEDLLYLRGIDSPSPRSTSSSFSARNERFRTSTSAFSICCASPWPRCT